MRRTVQISSRLCFLCLAPVLTSAQTNQQPSHAATASLVTNELANPTQQCPFRDDLQWLVGRWRCVTRVYLQPRRHTLGNSSEDSLEYLNVYLPFADEHQTLCITDDPNDRPIAAELLVRYVNDAYKFEERLLPLEEPGVVRISKDRLRYGHGFEEYEFRYSVERRDDWTWLTLQSKFMRLELYKMNSPLDELKTSHVIAPVKDFPTEKIAELRKRYEKLRQQAETSKQGTGKEGKSK